MRPRSPLDTHTHNTHTHTPQGRRLLYGWIQEHRRVPRPPARCGEFSYAGCVSAPRVMSLAGGRLWLDPLPELERLRGP